MSCHSPCPSKSNKETCWTPCLSGQTPTLVPVYIGDEILQLAVSRLLQRFARLLLQGLTDWTLRIVELDDREDSVANLAEIGLFNPGAHLKTPYQLMAPAPARTSALKNLTRYALGLADGRVDHQAYRGARVAFLYHC